MTIYLGLKKIFFNLIIFIYKINKVILLELDSFYKKLFGLNNFNDKEY